MKRTTVGLSDIGRVRKSNQDTFALFPELHLSIVADGMGGRPAGEIASKITAEAIHAFFLTATTTPPDLRLRSERRAHATGIGPSNRRVRPERRVRSDSFSDLALLHEAIVYANRKVIEAAEAESSRRGMGTTVVAMLARPTEVSIGFLGDSRAYLHREETLTQLTQDHSLVNEYIRQGILTPELAHAHPYRHVITRGVGVERIVQPETFKHSAQVGDLFLLCTDGLSNMLDADEINAILIKTKGNLLLAAKTLIDSAKEAAGKDNITVILVGYDE